MNYTKLDMNQQEYSDYVDAHAKKSPIIKDCCLAFLVGGLICVIGQTFTDTLQKYFDLSFKTASTYSTILLVFIAAVLTAFKLYAKIGKFAGAGSIVPITGFSNSIVSPAIEYKTEGKILGLGANMFKVAGPVLVYGICTSTLIGFIYWLIKLM